MSWTLTAEHPVSNELIIRRYQLDNGLSAVLLADYSAPIVSYQTWFRVGSRHEQPGRTGMAHFFEHLMFGKTQNVAAGEFDRLIERCGGDNNAATWNDWTFYRTSLPAAELELAVRLESDRMSNLILDDERIETEREVIINERKERVEDDVDGFLDERLNALAFTHHPYRWPTIGWMEDIRVLDRASVHSFYRTFYAPNNATVVLCGDFSEDVALDMLARYYGDMDPAEIPSEVTPVEPAQKAERRQVFAKPVNADRLIVGYQVPGQSDPDWLVLDFISALLSGGPSTRLYRRLIIETELASSLDCTMPPFRDPCLFRIGVSLGRNRHADDVLAEIDATIGELCDHLVSDAELTKIKNCVETDFWSALEDCDGKAEALGHYETTLGDFRRLFDMARRLGEITAEDVMRVVRTYLVPERRSSVIAQPGSRAGRTDEEHGNGRHSEEGAS
ncbi:MAG: insulinase family protein [Proteobacteria bacterium]|nr:insulinase family protein [Pseudomonadota bacterium]